MNPINTITLVCDNKKVNKKSSYLLSNLIGTTESYKATIWGERDYRDNEPKITSHQPVLFIGYNKYSELLIDSCDWMYDHLNMRYGWLGKKGVIYLERGLKKTEIKEFNNMFKKQDREFREYKEKLEESDKALVYVSPLLLAPQLWASLAICWLYKKHYDSEIVKTYQLSYLVKRFFFKSLDDFMGVK